MEYSQVGKAVGFEPTTKGSNPFTPNNLLKISWLLNQLHYRTISQKNKVLEWAQFLLVPQPVFRSWPYFDLIKLYNHLAIHFRLQLA